MQECLFCKIARKEIKATIVLEETDWLCFEDVNPKAPKHFLVIPKKHYKHLHDVDDDVVMANLMAGIKKVVKEQKIAESGYRIIANSGKDGGQTVNHVHFHILAGRPLGWPPG